MFVGAKFYWLIYVLHLKNTKCRKSITLISTLKNRPKIWLILHYRDLTLHQNRWHCDCHLLALHNWLQNFTVPNSVEPRCHSPPRLISEPIKNLSPQEFACIPKVSPTSMYLEVIEGKNMSLVCSIEVRSKLNNLDCLKCTVWTVNDVWIDSNRHWRSTL